MDEILDTIDLPEEDCCLLSSQGFGGDGREDNIFF
jgi:hypothetical protein